MKEKNIKEKHLECEVPEKEHYGKKFEDLTPEEMERIQGGGDVIPEELTKSLWMILSINGYKC